jgi:hypothetical protein
MDKSQPSSSRGAEGLPLGKKAEPVKTDKVKSDALKLLQKQYKKVKEEVELDEGMKPYVSSVSPKMGEKGSHDVMDKEGKVVKSYPHSKEGMKAAQSHLKKMKEDVEQLNEKNAPTNPELWSRAKALAKQKFDVYPSAYANGWASKWYKSKGGGWKTVSEAKDDLPFKADKPQKQAVIPGKYGAGYSMARQLARQAMQKQMQKMKKPVKEETMSKKAKIVKDAMKKPSKDDQFQAEPMISQSIVKNN